MLVFLGVGVGVFVVVCFSSLVLWFFASSCLQQQHAGRGCDAVMEVARRLPTQ